MKIENFRSIKSETIEFHDLTLLVGANDHGKSNLLKAIDAFFNREIDPGGFLIDNSFYEQNKRRDSGSSPLRITALIGNLPAGLQYTKRKLKQVPISIQFYADGDARVSFNSMELDRPKRHHNDQAYEKLIAIRDHFHVTYVPTFRNIEAELDPFANKSILFQMLSAYLGNAIERQQGGTSSEYRTMKRVKNEIDTLLKDSFDEIRQNAEKYLPSSLANTKFAFRFIPENTEDSRDLELSKILAKNTGIVNSITGSKISELGSGIQQAVTIGLLEKTCISRSRTSIILMEEPETFLHPNAQREIYLKLCSLAKRPSTQLVFTTHSPAILDATEISNICVIRKTKDHGSDNIVSKILQVRNADSVTNRRIVDDVELRKTFENSNVFFSELVVFVEGFSDELVLREALKKLAPHLMYRVSVVNCHGNTKFLTMIKFLENFKSESGHKIEWLIMCDKDSLRKGPIDDFKSLSPNLDWNYIDVAAASPIVTKDTAGNFNRNSVRIITGRLNRALEASRVRIFEADIEFALVTDANLAKACEQIRSFHQRGDATLNRFKSLDQVAMLIGSKGPNFNWQLDDENRKRWKRPELHRAIAASFKEADFSEDIKRAIRWIEQALSPTA